MVNAATARQHPARAAGTCLILNDFGTILHGEREAVILKSLSKVVNAGLSTCVNHELVTAKKKFDGSARETFSGYKIGDREPSPVSLGICYLIL